MLTHAHRECRHGRTRDTAKRWPLAGEHVWISTRAPVGRSLCRKRRRVGIEAVRPNLQSVRRRDRPRTKVQLASLTTTAPGVPGTGDRRVDGRTPVDAAAAVETCQVRPFESVEWWPPYATFDPATVVLPTPPMPALTATTLRHSGHLLPPGDAALQGDVAVPFQADATNPSPRLSPMATTWVRSPARRWPAGVGPGREDGLGAPPRPRR